MAFKKGNAWNGNRAGRPLGTGHRQQAFNGLVMPHREALLGKAIEMALDGNEPMLKLFLERLLPAKPTDEPVNLKIPDALNYETSAAMAHDVLRQVSANEITPQQAEPIMSLIKFFQDNVAAKELLDAYRKLSDSIRTLKGV